MHQKCENETWNAEWNPPYKPGVITRFQMIFLFLVILILAKSDAQTIKCSFKRLIFKILFLERNQLCKIGCYTPCCNFINLIVHIKE